MVHWYLNPRVWLLAILATIAALLFWRGGSASREEARELKSEVKATANSNEISRSTQRQIETEGYETQRRARADDQALRQGADPVAVPADDGGMRVVQRAYDEAIRASCRVRGEKSCAGAAAAREHD